MPPMARSVSWMAHFTTLASLINGVTQMRYLAGWEQFRVILRQVSAIGARFAECELSSRDLPSESEDRQVE